MSTLKLALAINKKNPSPFMNDCEYVWMTPCMTLWIYSNEGNGHHICTLMICSFINNFLNTSTWKKKTTSIKVYRFKNFVLFEKKKITFWGYLIFLINNYLQILYKYLNSAADYTTDADHTTNINHNTILQQKRWYSVLVPSANLWKQTHLHSLTKCLAKTNM